MKFKQKLEKTKQMLLGVWQFLVLKPLAFITNLIVPSQESTKSETTGQKLTRNCNHCGVLLSEGDNWGFGNVRKRNYICKSCDNVKSKRNRIKRIGK